MKKIQTRSISNASNKSLSASTKKAIDYAIFDADSEATALNWPQATTAHAASQTSDSLHSSSSFDLDWSGVSSLQNLLADHDLMDAQKRYSTNKYSTQQQQQNTETFDPVQSAQPMQPAMNESYEAVSYQTPYSSAPAEVAGPTVSGPADAARPYVLATFIGLMFSMPLADYLHKSTVTAATSTATAAAKAAAAQALAHDAAAAQAAADTASTATSASTAATTDTTSSSYSIDHAALAAASAPLLG